MSDCLEESQMEEKLVNVDRVWIDSDRPFEEVLDGYSRLVSRPNIQEFMSKTGSAKNFEEIEQIVDATVGPLGLMEFVRFPLGAFGQRDPSVEKPVKMIRFVLGNPLIMQSMARHVSEVGSYAPVTLLVFERAGKVRLRYDRLASLLAPYGSKEATSIARDLDEKIIGMMKEVP